ncbi:hypothetical protein IT087_02660, partial [Candidatus Uhrbacteria bacterium]|nr:hypothetical protein [Candidatus Uhrbacteria bacterium]
DLGRFIRDLSDSPWHLLKLRRSLKPIGIEPGSAARVVRELERLAL